jgi:predicted enzyme related to lactoylglutathione lyase
LGIIRDSAQAGMTYSFVYFFKKNAMSKITGIEMASIYATDFKESFEFYHNFLGLENYNEMGENAAYFTLPDDRGMYLVGKKERPQNVLKTARTTFAFDVESVFAMFEKLRAAGVETVETEPMDMGQGYFWFQAYDPSGNIIEFVGKK